MKKDPKSTKRVARALPTESVLTSLQRLRETCREVVASYLRRVENDITATADLVSAQAKARKGTPGLGADLRDMLMLLRGLKLRRKRVVAGI